MSEDKRCAHCGRVLPLTDYYIFRRYGKVVRQGWCKECNARYKHEQYVQYRSITNKRLDKPYKANNKKRKILPYEEE